MNHDCQYTPLRKPVNIIVSKPRDLEQLVDPIDPGVKEDKRAAAIAGSNDSGEPDESAERTAIG